MRTFTSSTSERFLLLAERWVVCLISHVEEDFQEVEGFLGCPACDLCRSLGLFLAVCLCVVVKHIQETLSHGLRSKALKGIWFGYVWILKQQPLQLTLLPPAQDLRHRAPERAHLVGPVRSEDLDPRRLQVWTRWSPLSWSCSFDQMNKGSGNKH